MADDPNLADAAHAMQTVTRNPLQPADRAGEREHLADFVGGHRQDRAARGRFGRDVPGLAPDDVEMADARTTMLGDDAPDGVELMGYTIDPDAVAAAIVDRLMAGGTLRAPSDEA
jgi:hypothetical protein